LGFEGTTGAGGDRAVCLPSPLIRELRRTLRRMFLIRGLWLVVWHLVTSGPAAFS
jgi:hypothetical protein